MDDADDDIFDIDYMARSIGDGDPAYTVMVYHITKHHVKVFDREIITKLWELGMHVEAKDLYERTLQFVASDGVYSFTSIAELWNAGMEDQAWQLHILKARWLPEGYPAGMINHYLHMHMHKLAQSLHDRTISVLYDDVDDDIYHVDQVVVCMVSMTAFGMKDQARELYQLTLKVREHFDWKIILKLKECGMELEADELIEFTLGNAKVHDARGIVELYKAGFEHQAEDFHDNTKSFVKVYDSMSIIKLYTAGMDSLEKAAEELHDLTLHYAEKFAVHDITGLYDAGMTTQAVQLFKQTLPQAKFFERSTMLALLGSGMENEAEKYFKRCVPRIHKYDLNGILALADAGYKVYASKMHSALLDEEDFNFTVKYGIDDANDRITKLRNHGLQKEANELQEILDVTLRKYGREGV
jgi:hypothetical protein